MREEDALRRFLGQTEHRRRYDAALIGRNLKRLRENRDLSVEEVRAYLGLGSVQAVYKYEAGRNYPQADLLLALMELYGADPLDLICERLVDCGALTEGDWTIYVPVKDLLETPDIFGISEMKLRIEVA